MKTWKRALALVLALVMALSLVALPSFAAGEEDSAGLPNGVSVVNPGGPTEGVTGMEMSKTLQLNADGKTGTLTLEAYATGNSQVVQKNVPLDIVLVLDQSGSMAYTFSGNTKRQAALKNAVKNFISSVADKYDPETSDHRMAVVTFDSSASTLVNWTQVDGTGKDTLTTAIDGLPKSPEGGTQVGKGMQRAQTLLDNSTYIWKDLAWLVTAPSGTGKSTHYCLWKLLCPDEIQIINGDKPIVYIENDEVFVTSSPWTGKENMSQRLTAKLGGIIVLEQSDSNEITHLTVHESAGKVFSQFLFDCNTEQEAKTACRIAEKMLKTPVWLLKNRGDIESAKLCRKTLQTYLESSASQ